MGYALGELRCGVARLGVGAAAAVLAASVAVLAQPAGGHNGPASSGFGTGRGEASPRPALASLPTEDEGRDAYGRLPLAFVPNAGQADRVRFAAQSGGASFALTPDEAGSVVHQLQDRSGVGAA
jgi:hypothetical protein